MSPLNQPWEEGAKPWGQMYNIATSFHKPGVQIYSVATLLEKLSHAAFHRNLFSFSWSFSVALFPSLGGKGSCHLRGKAK